MTSDVSDFIDDESPRSLIMEAFRNGSLVEQFRLLNTSPMTSIVKKVFPWEQFSLRFCLYHDVNGKKRDFPLAKLKGISLQLLKPKGRLGFYLKYGDDTIYSCC